MSTLQYVLRYQRRPELRAIGEFPDMLILPSARLETVNLSFGFPVMFVVVLESGESESEKANLSTWSGSLLRTSASIPAVDCAIHIVVHVNVAVIRDKRRILTFKRRQYSKWGRLERSGENTIH